MADNDASSPEKIEKTAAAPVPEVIDAEEYIEDAGASLRDAPAPSEAAVTEGEEEIDSPFPDQG